VTLTPTIELSTNAPTGNEALLRLGAPVLRSAIADLCRVDFLVFQKVELGMEIGPHHRKWWSRLKENLNVCEMAPRDHGKSMSLVQAYALWKTKYDPWCKEVLILGADQPSAVENLDKIKGCLAENPSLNYLIPANRQDFFSRTEVRLTNRKVIRVKGIGSPLRGRHPQLVILDDVLNEKNSQTAEARAAIKKYFWEVVFPLADKGTLKARQRGFTSQIVVVGTAQAVDDLYHDLQKNDVFNGEKLQAIIDEEEEEVLWPERYSYQDLIKRRAAMTPLFFAKEYQNEPLSDETTIFPPSLFEPLKDKNLSYVQSYTGDKPVYMGVDFSVPGSSDGDWTVVYVVEFDEDLQLFTPLAFWRKRPDTLQEQLHQIELFCQLYKVTTGCLEDNLFQGIYREHFANKTTLPLSGNTVTHSGKNSMEHGLLSFRPQFENGRWRFPYKTSFDQAQTDQMVTEFNGVVQRKGRIGNESFHDDVVMAMWHALCASKTSRFQVSWD